MKISATAQSSTSILVSWAYEQGDAIPEVSVTVNERTENGSLIATQSDLPPLTGAALFNGLQPSTTYLYEWCGKFMSAAGGPGNLSCHEPVEGRTSPTGASGGGSPAHATPVIDQLTPETARYGHAGSIYVHWQASSQYDKWHLMWRDKALPDELQYWSAVELKTNMAGSFAYRASNTAPGVVYTFKVQGCVAHPIFADSCSAYSAPADVTMHNSSSLRQWLGDTRLNPGILSLGQPTYGQGFRVMMGL